MYKNTALQVERKYKRAVRFLVFGNPETRIIKLKQLVLVSSVYSDVGNQAGRADHVLKKTCINGRIEQCCCKERCINVNVYVFFELIWSI